MAIRIVNEDGNGYKTRIYDAETGEDLTPKMHISSLSIDLRVDAVVSASMTIWPSRIDITAEKVEIRQQCPYCGHESEAQIDKQGG